MTLKYRLVTTADAKNNLSRYLDGVASNGETVLITRNGRPIAQIAPLDVEFAKAVEGAGISVIGGPETEAIIRLGTGREFPTRREHAEYLVHSLGNRPQPGFRIEVAGGEITLPPHAIETVTLPHAHSQIDWGDRTRFAELVTVFNTRFRVTEHDYHAVSANLVSGTPYFGFAAVDNNGEVMDRMHYIPRESVNYVYLSSQR